MSQQSRPSGITILVIVEIVLGVLLLLGAIDRRIQPASQSWTLESRATFLVILAALSFCLAFGLWVGKTWAWIGGVGLAAFGIIFSAFTLFIRPTVGEAIYLIANTIMIYFLIQPRVQRHFGHNQA